MRILDVKFEKPKNAKSIQHFFVKVSHALKYHVLFFSMRGINWRVEEKRSKERSKKGRFLTFVKGETMITRSKVKREVENNKMLSNQARALKPT